MNSKMYFNISGVDLGTDLGWIPIFTLPSPIPSAGFYPNPNSFNYDSPCQNRGERVPMGVGYFDMPNSDSITSFRYEYSYRSLNSYLNTHKIYFSINLFLFINGEYQRTKW
jgi:hypothetical protein